MKTIFLLSFIVISAYTQERVDSLTLSNSVNQVYGILKIDTSSAEVEESEESEFLSDFLWHLESFSKSQDIPVKFFECRVVIFNGKQIEFQENIYSMIIFVKKNSTEYLKIDGVDTDAFLAQESRKFYSKE